jgi:hypothetical protein
MSRSVRNLWMVWPEPIWLVFWLTLGYLLFTDHTPSRYYVSCSDTMEGCD